MQTIETLRSNVANLTASAYGAMRDYAIALNDTLPAMWYEVEASDKRKEVESVHAEKRELFKLLKEKNHSNPSTIWARVRKYAQEHREGIEAQADAAAGEGSGEGEGGERTTRSLKLRFIEELITLYKAGKRADGMEKDVEAAHTFIASALAELGVDLSTVTV
jgi:hypothetical protein